jgi:hypothetical protein
MIPRRFPAHASWSSLWIFLAFAAFIPLQTASQTGGSESKLVLGKPASSAERTIAIPLFFTAAEGETVGRIQAQIDLPEGGWKFGKAEPPKNSHLQVTAKQRMEEAGKRGEKSVRHAVIELSISAGSHAIRNGLIGYLQFSLPEMGTPPTGSPTVAKLETSPPVPEGAAEKPLPLPTEPIPPVVGCFFFSH